MVTHVVELENRKTTTYSGNYRAFAEKKAQLRAIQAEQYRLQQREIERLEQMAKRLFSYRNFSSSRSKLKMIDRMEKVEKPVETRSTLASRRRPRCSVPGGAGGARSQPPVRR